MRVAFYAPLKAPTHAVPSGDRRVAGLLIDALAHAGHAIELPSSFRSRDASGQPDAQARIMTYGRGLADQIVRRMEARDRTERPDVWFTYHLYYKAPDWIGPIVARHLKIPYVVAEASVAAKRAGGPWDLNHRAVLNALELADVVFELNPDDREGVRPHLKDACRLITLRPFLDGSTYQSAANDRDQHREDLARRFALDPGVPWLLAVSMMREGDKAQSYATLSKALERVRQPNWNVIVVGNGEARADVESAIRKSAGARAHFLGELALDELPALYAASDIYVWPAVNEAFGMSILEAQASGLPVVAGSTPGVASIVADGITGKLVPVGDVRALTHAVDELLDRPNMRVLMAAAARDKARQDHEIATASQRIDKALRSLFTEAAA